MSEKRIQDEELGASLLESIVRKERGTFTCFWDDEEIALEPFDEPLVVQRVDKLSALNALPAPASTTTTTSASSQDSTTVSPVLAPEKLIVTFPYNVRVALNFESLTVDEWDRFHGRTPQGIPFVFSRKAQAQLFDYFEEFDDESVTWLGQQYPIKPWLNPNPAIQTAEFWDGLYQQSKDGWELNAPAPALVDMLPRLKLPKSRVLVLGCGRGNDAAFFAESGHLVTAVDISADAIAAAKERYPQFSNITWLHQDIFAMPVSANGQFDVVFEHTCYCAVDPEKRNQLVKLWNRLLMPQGFLMGVFFVMDRPSGPPFGGTEWELRERLKRYYQFQFWGRWKKSTQRRQGSELFVLGSRRNSDV